MKNFNFSITFIITTLLILLSGCDSVETTSTKTSTTETEVFGIKNIQVEQNSTLVVIEEINSTEIETEPEQNDTVEIAQVVEVTQPIEITPPTPDIPVVEERELDYRQKFINEERCNQIIDKEFLIICYDYTLKAAKSVAYTLYGGLVNDVNIEDRPSFHIETEIDKEYRATTADYTNSGYDRGHLAPDASFDWSQESLDATYSLANIIPQVPVVNRQMWLKAENYARGKAFDLFEINVVNVVKYSTTPQYIGENNISVSIGFYKILFSSDKEYEECLYYANDLNASAENDQLENHIVDCAEIE